MSPAQTSVAIVPVHNEIRYDRVVGALARVLSRVVVVDDGSDEPPRLADPVPPNAVVHRFDENRGYGDVVQWGIEHARAGGYDKLIFVDGDGQHDTAYVELLLEQLPSSDIVVGNRMSSESQEVGIRQPAERYAANRYFARVLRRLCTRTEVRDFFSGFIAFSVSAIPVNLDLSGSRYASPARMWPCMLGAGLKVAHVTVPRIYYSAENGFIRQYGTMEMLGRHLVSEFTESCFAHLGIPRLLVLDSLRQELEEPDVAPIRPWLTSTLSAYMVVGP